MLRYVYTVRFSERTYLETALTTAQLAELNQRVPGYQRVVLTTRRGKG